MANSLNDNKFAQVTSFGGYREDFSNRPYLRIEAVQLMDGIDGYACVTAHFSGIRNFIRSSFKCDLNDMNDIFEKFVNKEFLLFINLVPNLSIDPNTKFVVSINNDDVELQFGAFKKHVVALCETVIAEKLRE